MKTMQKSLTSLLGVMIATVPVMASAGNRDSYDEGSYYDYATVISSTPVVEVHRVNRPRQECREVVVEQRSRHQNSYTRTVVGGILGGVVGNRFGRGRGNTAATVAGTLLGASLGRDLSYEPESSGGYRTETRCSQVNRYYEEEQVVGYRVKYRYHGQVHTTQTDERPGSTMRVRVDVEPDSY